MRKRKLGLGKSPPGLGRTGWLLFRACPGHVPVPESAKHSIWDAETHVPGSSGVWWTWGLARVGSGLAKTYAFTSPFLAGGR